MCAHQPILRSLCAIVLFILNSSVADAADPKEPGLVRHPLTNQHSKPFAFENLLGKPSVVHFGFTNCAVVCPTMLNGVAVYMQKLGKRSGELNFVFVSVDPERDTAKILKEYIENFDARIIGVTGSAEGIANFANRIGTRYEKRDIDGGGYEMAHVIFAYLLDKTGKMISTLYMGAESNPEVVMRRLTALID